MDRYICIHGHFYQPPRENPWLEEIELQDSATPYHDWNERITAECYAPNASSRILDDANRIVKIENNYARISFNFGPTLLSWLERKSRDAYAAIVAADAASRAQFSGHGSAIAQAYNHLIMPLASRRDKETQVLWGIRDFERRFGRKPEGMWLPETAVDLESLDILAEHGILFTILAPHQAKSVRAIGETAWNDVSGARVDPSMPYRLTLESGRTIAIFFYDGPISRGVAFERLLHKGEYLADRLVGAFSATRKRPQLVHIATDGETYGHHHSKGDMALAYALDYIERHELARLTNYGEFLELSPPTHEVQIHEDTAWSCPHGVSRWRADCGCNSGAPQGWNQQWRGPLRDALDWLRDEVAPRFENEGRELFGHPWRARNHYIDVILEPGDESVDHFLSQIGHRTLDSAQRVRALQLLELQRNAMLMYTSCGWFFNDLSGIETTQILRYAGRVLQLAKRCFGVDFEPEFLERLSKAKSNLAEQGTGREIYERHVRPAIVEFAGVAANYAIASLFEAFPSRGRIYCYDVEQEGLEIFDAGSAKVSAGKLRIRSRVTQEVERVMFGVLYLGDVKLTGGSRPLESDEPYEALRSALADPDLRNDFAAVVRLLDRSFASLPFSIRSLFRDEQRSILSLIWNAALAEAEAAFRALHDRYVPLVKLHSDLSVPLPKVLSAAAEADLNLRLRRALERDDVSQPLVASLIAQARSEQVTLDHASLAYALKRTLDRVVATFAASPREVASLETLHAAVALARSLPFEIDLGKAQNVYYGMLGRARERTHGNGEGHERWIELFRSLGTMLSMQQGLVDAALSPLPAPAAK
ncbi:MAG: DUF3536 domain-containing protein [Thermoanaerobaculia bacterium]|jgi:alpha-amylase/alpha-mannosidase (GH57 family)